MDQVLKLRMIARISSGKILWCSSIGESARLLSEMLEVQALPPQLVEV